MNAKIDSAIEKIRTRAQALYRQLDQAGDRADDAVQQVDPDIEADARELAAAVRKLMQERQSAAAAHFANAAASFDAAAAEAKKAATAKAATLREHRHEALLQLHNALQGLSHGLAQDRSASPNPKPRA